MKVSRTALFCGLAAAAAAACAQAPVVLGTSSNGHPVVAGKAYLARQGGEVLAAVQAEEMKPARLDDVFRADYGCHLFFGREVEKEIAQLPEPYVRQNVDPGKRESAPDMVIYERDTRRLVGASRAWTFEDAVALARFASERLGPEAKRLGVKRFPVDGTGVERGVFTHPALGEMLLQIKTEKLAAKRVCMRVTVLAKKASDDLARLAAEAEKDRARRGVKD